MSNFKQKILRHTKNQGSVTPIQEINLAVETALERVQKS